MAGNPDILIMFDKMFGGAAGGVLQYGVLVIIACVCIGLCWKMYKEQSKYRVFTDVYSLVGGSYKLYRTKAAMVQNAVDKTYRLTSRKFGDDDQIDIRPPDKSFFSDYEKNLWNFPFLPRVQSEQISFLNPKKDVYIPIRKSFIFLKRGQDLNLTRKEDCDFCKYDLDIERYIHEEDYFNAANNTYPDLDHSKCCEKHFNDLVNARFEALDPADISWMWKKQEEFKKKYEEIKFYQQPAFIAAVSYVFVLGVIIFTYKIQPEMYKVAFETYSGVVKSSAENIAMAKYNGTLPTN